MISFCWSRSHICCSIDIEFIRKDTSYQPTGEKRKSAAILQQAADLGAKPWEALETAVQNLKLGKCQLLSQEDKENIAGLLLKDFFFHSVDVVCIFCHKTTKFDLHIACLKKKIVYWHKLLLDNKKNTFISSDWKSTRPHKDQLTHQEWLHEVWGIRWLSAGQPFFSGVGDQSRLLLHTVMQHAVLILQYITVEFKWICSGLLDLHRRSAHRTTATQSGVLAHNTKDQLRW